MNIYAAQHREFKQTTLKNVSGWCAEPKLAGNDWIAPVQRLLLDGRFCDVSSGPTASQQPA